MLLNWMLAGLVLLGASAPAVLGGQARIFKVLPQLLDLQGRAAVTPSLFDRDAYQAHLRTHPAEVSALRFMVEWKMRGRRARELRLRVEARGQKGHRLDPLTVEERAHPSFWRQWTSLRLSRQAYRQLASVEAWRATLWDGTKLLAEQRSFLW